MIKKLLFALGFMFGLDVIFRIFLNLVERRIELVERLEDMIIFDKAESAAKKFF